MFEGRFSKLLQKLAFWGSSHKYELLAKGELETLWGQVYLPQSSVVEWNDSLCVKCSGSI
ncbi:hypothetical protein MG293_014957 [Ovis ammon polii]|uniref:Uncharacterized protein n=1 Tax=Ovis ammon polii TaxID=230172 RepID=A0AAD4TWS9_OVIAM|nr:hypothetical protein MG293_014957 [Ovis ammon polii]